MLKQVGYPLGALHIALSPRYRLHVGRIHHRERRPSREYEWAETEHAGYVIDYAIDICSMLPELRL
jgi:hypothetical protein